ncbi:hypothetical protein HELRODRAFT_181284 [Helobdella robusta]|uniref:Uncharacterized protein n=1 Tax=Helobdella robusta TaxID=6412 RepID=T1FGU4_HELRO|nr:hypothetical protein HELRODRAFT_181284 [Helobdella robusta]ESN93171.1 hypothetical protein HELRODRAFT_181284 [Helobdella robusta]
MAESCKNMDIRKKKKRKMEVTKNEENEMSLDSDSKKIKLEDNEVNGEKNKEIDKAKFFLCSNINNCRRQHRQSRFWPGLASSQLFISGSENTGRAEELSRPACCPSPTFGVLFHPT